MDAEAKKAYDRAYRIANKDRIREARLAWHARHPGYNTKKSRKWKAENPERARELSRLSYRRIREREAGRPMPDACEICEEPRGDDHLYFDHCHQTEKFRGWLCNGCNSALGMVKDNPTTLRKMIQYLTAS